MYKYGIVSTASIAPRFIEGLRLAGEEIVCIGSRDINKSKDFALKEGIKKYYGSYQEVYEDKEVDVVYIPLINNLHYESCKEALLKHKNVVLEKPFTTDEKQAEELFKIAEKNNCFLFEGVKNVFVPSTNFVKIHLSDIGKVDRITTHQGIKKPFPETHWMNDIKQGGGAYIGSASYVYHYLKNLFNLEVSDIDGTYVPSSNSDLICDFSFKLGNIKVNSVIDMSKDLDNECVIYGQLGKIIIHDFWRSHHVEVIINSRLYAEYKDDGNEFVYEIKHVQECLNKGLLQSPIITSKDSIDEVKYINYLYRKWNMID